PSKLILNLRGSTPDSGCRRKYRVVASEYGVGSNTSVGEMPAKWHAVMLRTELPHASRLVMPASATRACAFDASATLTKWNWKFCRVVMWPKPRDQLSATSASA